MRYVGNMRRNTPDNLNNWNSQSNPSNPSNPSSQNNQNNQNNQSNQINQSNQNNQSNQSSQSNPSNQNERAVFPPGSIVPDSMSDNAVMYNENSAAHWNGSFQNNSQQTDTNAENMRSESFDNFRDDNMQEGQSRMHGFMDYDGMEFPLPPGSVLRRSDQPMNYVGTVKDPAGFSPANGLAGRPAETMSGMQGTAMGEMQNMSAQDMGSMSAGLMSGNSRMQNTMMGSLKNNTENEASMTGMCSPSVRLSDIMCMYKGKNIEVEFLFGADTYVKKSGILSGAGMNFIVLTDSKTGQKTVCDLTDMKFLNLLENGGME